MPKEGEIQAVLDVLFLSKMIAGRFEEEMWSDAKRIRGDVSVLGKLKGEMPERMHPGWAKRRFDEHFAHLVYFAVEQAEKVRAGAKAADIFPVCARIVYIQREKWGVEVQFGPKNAEIVDGFRTHNEAWSWAKFQSEEYLRKKGTPAGQALIIIGDEYF